MISNIVWALFGNDLDGVDANSPQAAQWRPDLPIGSWKRRILWWVRNPFHNLFFHVLGVVSPETNQRKPGWLRWSKTGNPDSNWAEKGFHFCVIFHAYLKRPVLPFISYKGKIEFYAGWRERGNLGFALRKGT